MRKILIVGAGNVGLAAAAVLLSHGHEVEHVESPQLEKQFELQLRAPTPLPDFRWAEVFTDPQPPRYNRPAHRKARNNWK